MPYAADGIISQDPMPGGIEITDKQYADALAGMLAGLVVTIGDGFKVAPASAPEPPTPTEEERLQKQANEEALWRVTQMSLAQENVTAIEFGDDSILGTAEQWKAYWIALRTWKEGAEHYPDPARRPIRPA